jgi:hypothetical protein
VPLSLSLNPSHIELESSNLKIGLLSSEYSFFLRHNTCTEVQPEVISYTAYSTAGRGICNRKRVALSRRNMNFGNMPGSLTVADVESRPAFGSEPVLTLSGCSLCYLAEFPLHRDTVATANALSRSKMRRCSFQMISDGDCLPLVTTLCQTHPSFH